MLTNKYPVYVVSKSRHGGSPTVDVLNHLGVHYHVVIEADQYDDYAENYDASKLLILPQSYIDDYDTCDDLGTSKSKGPGAARNFAWEHSIATYGAKWHWVMDDNIYDFQRMNRNIKVAARTMAWFCAMESFVDRYTNLAIAGPNYSKFCKSTDKVPPLVFNTRIYSCLLIRNDIDYRWRGRYNEDTDLSLRVLKDGWCTVQFNAFLVDKNTTQRSKGGNDLDFYSVEGTKPKSQMLKDLHPDVTEVVWKFSRWHHKVDYRPFKGNILKKKVDFEVNDDPEYGMKLVDIGRDNIGRRTIDDGMSKGDFLK